MVRCQVGVASKAETEPNQTVLLSPLVLSSCFVAPKTRLRYRFIDIEIENLLCLAESGWSRVVGGKFENVEGGNNRGGRASILAVTLVP